MVSDVPFYTPRLQCTMSHGSIMHRCGPAIYSLLWYESHSILLSFCNSTIGNKIKVDTVPSTIFVNFCGLQLLWGLD